MTTPEKRALRVAGQELAGLADDLPNPAWIAYADGYIFWYNSAWYDYTGTTPEDVEGWGWASVHHPDGIAGATDIWTKAIAAGKPVEITVSLRGKDGSYRPFLTRAVPICDPAGAVVRWFGTNADISAQVAAEERALRAEEVWRNLFDEMQEGFVVAEMTSDRDGAPHDAVIVKTNKQFERLTGLPNAEAVGLSVRDVTGNAASLVIETFAGSPPPARPKPSRSKSKPLGGHMKSGPTAMPLNKSRRSISTYRPDAQRRPRPAAPRTA